LFLSLELTLARRCRVLEQALILKLRAEPRITWTTRYNEVVELFADDDNFKALRSRD